MRRNRRPKDPTPSSLADRGRLERPLTLIAQVEQILREAIRDGRFPANRLPTEVDLAEQLGVSRETVRLAAERLQREGLLVKYRRKGTFTQPPPLTLREMPARQMLLGYLQADYFSPSTASHETERSFDQEEAVTRVMRGLMLQGALAEAARANCDMAVRQASPARMGEVFRRLQEGARLNGVIFASFGGEKLLRRATGLGLPIVLLDHDLHLPNVSSVRDDSFGGARQAVASLAELGHRRIAFAQWRQADLNPWRVTGYRQGMREASLPRRRAWEIPIALTTGGACQFVERWLQLAPRPTAAICFNNSLARLIIHELRTRGIRVPFDISIMGCGGEDVPDLTCHQTDWYELGKQAVTIMLRALNEHSRSVPEHFLMPHTVQEGATTGPACDQTR
jgi:DNA-binding LacI/PurR family transcriptional regulator/DNA-binding transcriptional regulator YhcF (GntR family)